jgi:hypothetical protein
MGNVSGTIQKLREAIRRECYEVFLISDHVHPYVLPGSNPDWEERARQFDGITSWLGGYSGEGIYLGGSYEAQLGILYSQWGDLWKPWLGFISAPIDAIMNVLMICEAGSFLSYVEFVESW